MTASRNPNAREITAEEARRALVERLRVDPAFAEALIADPAIALAGVNLRALFNVPEEDEVQGYMMAATCGPGPVWLTWC
jgi:hypothetical protein